ncbi:putative membrane-anchored protein [Bradyrhizobium japonicum]|nr:putative membrane-anchored protein [Bradyrhizobium japonicum]MCP1784624.1 putative membrane-anchored protein [Bradyrhizobium japonicum]MCP1794898.1 putative membrane-anchored protein [Bradyrhizobium japonicum]MCP1810823.1 putative membrane-anchored protein [Bradyrhizobium japonicum]MCP1821580.1 putative membrane-anchored protein [Bradyrhizobium japonicum]
MAEIIALEQERLAGRLRQGVGKAVAIVQAGCVPRGSGSLIARLNTSPSSAGCHPLSAIARLSGKQQLCRVKLSIVHGAKMKALTRFAFVFALSLFAGAALAQQGSNDQAWVELKKLDWKYGPTQGDIATVASIGVPKDAMFLGSVGSRRFLELMGNLGSDGKYTFAPRSLNWFAVFNFDPSGYVKDDETLDPDELLGILKKNNVAGNDERRRRGLETLVLEGWYVVPHYDIQTKRLEWGTKLREESGDVTVNYTIRLLGRSGVMNATLVSSPGAR